VFRGFCQEALKQSIISERQVLRHIVSFAVDHYPGFHIPQHQKYVSLIEAREEFGAYTADKYAPTASKTV